MKKVVLDFDIGTEIDDALALAYLLAEPQCELMGITTVTGEAVKRAQLASVLCNVANKDIPIMPGCEKPLIVPQTVFCAPQASVLEDWNYKSEYKKNSAVSFMREIIRSNPHEITLLGTAPMTNIGLLFALDPEIPELLEGMMLLCGNTTHRRYDNASEKFSAMERDDMTCILSSQGIVENNALIDPHATYMVYNTAVKNFRTVGSDVSSRLFMTPQDAERKFKHPLLKAVYAIAKEWFKDEPRVTFHDPLAAVCIFHDDVCKFEKGNISIEIKSDILSGFMYWEKSEEGRHQVATKVNEAVFFERLFEVFDD